MSPEISSAISSPFSPCSDAPSYSPSGVELSDHESLGSPNTITSNHDNQQQSPFSAALESLEAQEALDEENKRNNRFLRSKRRFPASSSSGREQQQHWSMKRHRDITGGNNGSRNAPPQDERMDRPSSNRGSSRTPSPMRLRKASPIIGEQQSHSDTSSRIARKRKRQRNLSQHGGSSTKQIGSDANESPSSSGVDSPPGKHPQSNDNNSSSSPPQQPSSPEEATSPQLLQRPLQSETAPFTQDDILSFIQALYELPIIYQQRGLKFPPQQQFTSPNFLIQHLESYYDNYHKNSMIQALFKTVLAEFQKEISIEIPRYPDTDRVSSSIDIFTQSEKWKSFLTRNRSKLERLAKQLSTAQTKSLLRSADKRLKSIDSTVSTAESADWDFLNVYGVNDLMDTRMISNRELNEWSENLLPSKPLDVRKSAMDSLVNIYVGDLVTREPWKRVIESLSLALSDSDETISKQALQLFCKMYMYAHAEAVIHMHLGILRYLSSIFNSKSAEAFAVSAGDDQFMRMYRFFRLLNHWQKDAPSHWNGFSEDLAAQFFDAHFELLGIKLFSTFQFCEEKEANQKNSPSETTQFSVFESPLLYLSYLDTKAEWFRAWNKERRTRKYISQGKHQQSFFQQLTKLLHHVRLQTQENNSYLSLILQNDNMFLMLVHSVCILGSLICTQDGAAAVDTNRILEDLIFLFIRTGTLHTGSENHSKRRHNLLAVLTDTLQEAASCLRLGKSDIFFSYSHVEMLIECLDVSLAHSSLYISIARILSFLMQHSTARTVFFMSNSVLNLSQCNRLLKTLLKYCEKLFCLPSSSENRSLKLAYFQLIRVMSQYAEFNWILCGTSVRVVEYKDSPQSSSLQTHSTQNTITDVTTNPSADYCRFNFVKILGQHFDDPNLPQEQMLDILVTFALYTTGLREIRRQSLLPICVEHLMERFYLEPSDESKCSIHGILYTLFCQLCSLSSGLKTCLERNFVQNLCEDFMQRSKENFDWIPSDEIRQSETVPEIGTELFGLLLTLPHFVITFSGGSSKRRDASELELNAVANSRAVDLLFKHLIINESETLNDDVCMRGLLVLESLIDNLNSSLLLEHKYKFFQYLMDKQVMIERGDLPTQKEEEPAVSETKERSSTKSSPVPGGKHVPFKDECILMRNRIIAKLYSLGGPNEKLVPSRAPTSLAPPSFAKQEVEARANFENDTIYNVQVLTKDTLSNCMAKHYTSLSKSEKEFLRLLKKTSVDELTLDHMRQLFSIPHEKLLSTLSARRQLLRRMVSTLPNNLLQAPSGFDTVKFAVTRASICSIGDRLVARYAKYLQIENLEQFEKEACDKLRNVLHVSVFEALNGAGKPHRKTSNYDWFSAVCLLLFQNADMAFTFLSKFSKRPESFFLWYEKSRTLAHADSSQLVHPVLIITELVEYLLRFEYERDFHWYRMQGYSPLPLISSMISQFFLNWLNMDNICNILMLTLLRGADWIVYICVCCLHHICERNLKQDCDASICFTFQQSSQWKNNYQALQGFRLEEYLDKMQEMESKYRSMCLERMTLVAVESEKD